MNKKKTIAVGLVLALVLVVGGVLAYFTDTETVTNLFTIGNVDITLTEPSWVATDANSDGIPDAAQAVTPGTVIAKDPTVTVNAGSNDAYVFIKVEVPAITTETSSGSGVYTAGKKLFTYSLNSGWEEVAALTTVSATSETKVYAYVGSTAGSLEAVTAGTTLTALFDDVTVNGTITNAEVTSNFTGNQSVIVTGYGIQSDGLSVSSPADVFGLF